MKYILFVFSVVLLCSSCDTAERSKAEWESAPREYTCTEEQMTRVQSEAGWCNENTSYFSSFCYGSAIIRNCTKFAVKP